MSEAILKALMQLFALVVDIDAIQEISEKEKAIIRSFLSRQLSSELVEKYMDIFLCRGGTFGDIQCPCYPHGFRRNYFRDGPVAADGSG